MIDLDIDDWESHEARPDVKSWRQAWKDFREVVNGGYQKGEFRHYCVNDECCKNRQWKVLLGKFIRAVKNLVFLFMPKAPAARAQRTLA